MSGKISVESIHGKDAPAFLAMGVADLRVMYGKGGKDRERAALEIGRRAFNKPIKSAAKKSA